MPCPSVRPLFALALVASGCAFFSTSFDKSGEASAGRRYTGTECEAIELEERTDWTRDDAGTEKRSVRMFSQQPARVDPLPMRVTKVACGDAVEMYPRDGGASAYVQYHHDFDAPRFDHATAALILTMCNKDSSCIGPVGPNTARDPAARHYAAGQLSFYAEGVKPEAVDADLKAAGVSQGLRRHFLAELDSSARRPSSRKRFKNLTNAVRRHDCRNRRPS